MIAERFKLTPGRMLAVLFGIIAVLLALCVGSRAMLDITPGDTAQRVFNFLDFDREDNLPSFYSAVQLLLAAGLAIRLRFATRGAPESPWWVVVAAMLVVMAVDEWFALHEHLSEPVRALMGPDVPYFAWVIPYSLLAGAVVLLLLRFWWRQEEPVRWLLALAASLYVAGAIGMEVIGADIFASGRRFTLLYFFITTLEETLELSGVAVLIFALLLKLQRVSAAAVDPRGAQAA